MKIHALGLTLFVVSGLMAEEAKSFKYRGSGYGYFTGGMCQHSYSIVGGGAGGEGFLWKGLTLGLEGGYQAFVGDVGFGELYLPVGYHFVDRNKPVQWDPFISISLAGLYAGNGGYGNAGHLGGGVIYWVKQRFGIRTEFRTHLFAGQEITGQVRLGISFR